VGHPGWVVYACRTTYTAEVAETIWRRGETIVALVDNQADAGDAEDLADLGARVLRPDQLTGTDRSLPAVIPLLTPGFRSSVEREARRIGLTLFPDVVDPTAVVARTASLSEGSVLNAGSVIGANTRIERFVHVNRTASVGHDNVVEDYATLGPGCVLAGHVVVGRGAFVGAGAVLAPKVRVGTNAVIGAGAVVVKDVEPATTVVGNPARVLRAGTGYGGVNVPEPS